MTPAWRTLRPVSVSPGRATGRQPQALLPIEVWDLVLQTLVADHRLLQIACVCRVFNELAIALYLRRKKIEPSTGVLTVYPDTLTALHLSCGHFPINTLSCRLFTLDLLRSMRTLRAVVEKCPDLTNLHLKWRTERFNVEKTFPLALCDVLYAMSKRMTGPVIVGTNFISRFKAADLCMRQRYNWIPARIQRVLKVEDGASQFSAQLKAQGLAYPTEVQIQCIPAELGPFKCFTLIAFDTGSLTLAPTKTLSAADISTILPHLRVASLRFVYLCTDAIDPTALSQFLSRHTGITAIHFVHTVADGPCHPLCTPPVVLPSLSKISSSDAAKIPALLDAFELSPNLHTIVINLHRTPPFKRALRHISLRTSTMRLVLHLPRKMGAALRACPPDDEERAILSALHSVHVIMLFATSIADARAVLPWLAMLPALQTLELQKLNSKGAKRVVTTQLLAFIAEARTALPSIVDVWTNWR